MIFLNEVPQHSIKNFVLLSPTSKWFLYIQRTPKIYWPFPILKRIRHAQWFKVKKKKVKSNSVNIFRYKLDIKVLVNPHLKHSLSHRERAISFIKCSNFPNIFTNYVQKQQQQPYTIILYTYMLWTNSRITRRIKKNRQINPYEIAYMAGGCVYVYMFICGEYGPKLELFTYKRKHKMAFILFKFFWAIFNSDMI